VCFGQSPLFFATVELQLKFACFIRVHRRAIMKLTVLYPFVELPCLRQIYMIVVKMEYHQF